MIERFNFYDIYGYFLPGCALLVLAWLPYGLTTGAWPELSTTGAIAALVIAYLAGVLLQGVAAPIIPTRTLDRRLPSDRLLDRDDGNIDGGTKDALARKIDSDLGIDVLVPGGDLALRRQTAFSLARAALLQAKVGAYAEQFEGMLALMRGLCVAAAAASAWSAGWLTRSFGATSLVDLLARMFLLALLISLLVNFRGRNAEEQSGSFAAILILCLFLGGFALAAGRAGRDDHVSLAVIMLAGAFVASRAYAAYAKFTVLFARTVLLDYLRLR